MPIKLELAKLKFSDPCFPSLSTQKHELLLANYKPSYPVWPVKGLWPGHLRSDMTTNAPYSSDSGRRGCSEGQDWANQGRLEAARGRSTVAVGRHPYNGPTQRVVFFAARLPTSQVYPVRKDLDKVPSKVKMVKVEDLMRYVKRSVHMQRHWMLNSFQLS